MFQVKRLTEVIRLINIVSQKIVIRTEKTQKIASVIWIVERKLGHVIGRRGSEFQ
jgi:hypothetical protein